MRKIMFVLAVALVGCNAEKIAVKRLAIMPEKVKAEYCASRYPSLTEIRHEVEYKEGKTDTLWRSEYVDCDTVIGQDRVVKIPYAVQIRSRDSVIVREVRIEQNKAQIEALTLSLNKSLAEAETLRKRLPNAVYAGIFVGLVICFVLYLLFKRNTYGII